MLIDYQTDPKIWEILDRMIPLLQSIAQEKYKCENPCGEKVLIETTGDILTQIEHLRTRIKTTSQEPITAEEKNLLYNILRIYRLGYRLLEIDEKEIDKLIELVIPNSYNFIFDEEDIYKNA
jgi:hypothetical protein